MNKKIAIVGVGDVARMWEIVLINQSEFDVIRLPSCNDARLISLDSTIKIALIDNPAMATGIREKRKDLTLGVYSETTGLDPISQYHHNLLLLKSLSANLVLARDQKTAHCMVVAPEETHYHDGKSFGSTCSDFLDMLMLRSHLTFTRSTVVNGEPVPWNSELVPSSLRTVVNYLIDRGAYKAVNNMTAGHFAVKLDETTFLTSRRKTNFNRLNEVGLVKVVTDGPDTVIAYGSKPSVGGQSQRIVFQDHAEYDCIVHFHCPLKEGSIVPVVSQREFECGSHECGHNTSRGLKKFGKFSAVYLDNHGPNIVFNRDIDPQELIDFSEQNFCLEEKTGGYIGASSTQEDFLRISREYFEKADELKELLKGEK